MKYIDIVKSSPSGGEKMMWGSVERISDFLCKMMKEEPEMVSHFLKSEYEAMNGKHINEWLANELVSRMYHTENGKRVDGEVVTVEEASRLLDGMPDEMADKLEWDAYVGANGFMHDLTATGMTKDAILKAAKHFWFHDDDFTESDKVYWYYAAMLF